MTTPRILFVDDESNVLDGLRRCLRDQQPVWEMYFTQGVEEALSVLQAMDPDVVISDIVMSGMDGFELLARIRNTQRTRDLPFLMLTGLNERGIKRKALDLGATDLLNKPTDTEELIARINSMLRLKAYQDEIKDQNALLDQRVKERTAELEASRLDLIWRLGRTAEYRDTDTGNHIVRVGYYCKVLAETMGTDREWTRMIFLTSPLHDIGKIGIPDNILLKKGKLDANERKIMQQHCAIGADILRQDALKTSPNEAWCDLFAWPDMAQDCNPLLEMAATIALSHHERWDGTGYPAGLSQAAIPLEARITAVADVYDALCSPRSYKPGYNEKKVLHIMRQEIGCHFDPMVFACFEKSRDVFRDIRIQFGDQTHNAESTPGISVRSSRNIS